MKTIKSLFSKTPDPKSEILKAIDRMLDPKLRFNPRVGVPDQAILQIAEACGFKISKAEHDEAERIAAEFDRAMALLDAHDHHHAVLAHKTRHAAYGPDLANGETPAPTEIRDVVKEFSRTCTAIRHAAAAGPCRQACQLFVKLAGDALDVTSTDEFKVWTQTSVRKLFPHEMLIAGVAQRNGTRVDVDGLLFAGFPLAFLERRRSRHFRPLRGRFPRCGPRRG